QRADSRRQALSRALRARRRVQPDDERLAPDRADACARWLRRLGRARPARRRRGRKLPVSARLQPRYESLAEARVTSVSALWRNCRLDRTTAVALAFGDRTQRARVRPPHESLVDDSAGAVPGARRAERYVDGPLADRLGRRDRNTGRNEHPAEVP